jgi:hypothetical protein
LLQAEAAQAARVADRRPFARIKACIFIFYYGGPSHLDTFDLKPGAPAEIRGEFGSIATTVPGLRVCEHLPRTARVMHKVALVRSMSHLMRNHDSACAETFTGRSPLGGDRDILPEEPSTTFPNLGAIMSHVWRNRHLPVAHAALPFVMNNVLRNPGQTPGFLGASCAPLQIHADPDACRYRADMLKMPEDVTPERVGRRRALLHAIEGGGPAGAGAAPMQVFYEKAFELLRSDVVCRALDIEQEPARVRDRYGRGPRRPDVPDSSMPGNGAELGFARNMRGQNLLLGRRLVEAGVPFVNVYDFKQQGQNWDSHRKNFSQLKDHLLPPADQAFTALVEDLDGRGLLDTTLVVALGEFGRTPLINKDAGRDHWPNCYSALLAGGGVKGGLVYGASDKVGAYPASNPVTPADLAATIFWRFGIDPATEIHDMAGRPYRLTEGKPVHELFL